MRTESSNVTVTATSSSPVGTATATPSFVPDPWTVTGGPMEELR